MVVMATLIACGSQDNQPRPKQDTAPQATERPAQPLNQEKTADVKTETGGEHFAHDMASSGVSMLQAIQKPPAPRHPQQSAMPSMKPEPVPAAAMPSPSKMQQPPGKTVPTGMKESINTATAGTQVVGTTWKKCVSCHSFDVATKVGPGLGKGDGIAGVFGRKAGASPGFRYKFTKYIKGDVWTWDEEHLRKWMCNSKKAIKEFTGDASAKTRMPAQRICKPADQDSVLSKLKSVS